MTAMTTFFRSTLLLLAFSAAATASAQEPEKINSKEDYTINTDRPSVAYACNIVPVGAFQFELGYQFARSSLRNFDVQEYSHVMPNITFRTGLTPRWEAFLSWDVLGSRTVVAGQEIDKSFSSNALTVGTRFSIFDKAEGNRPQLAFFGAVSLPYTLPSAQRQNASLSSFFRFSAQHEWGNISFFYNLGANFSEERDGINTYLQTTPTIIVGAGCPVAGNLAAYVEAYNYMPLRNFVYRQGFDGGFTYTIKRRILLDLVGGIEFDKDAVMPYFTVGFSACL